MFDTCLFVFVSESKKVMKKSQEKYAKNITLNFQLKYSLCVLMITDYLKVMSPQTNAGHCEF